MDHLSNIPYSGISLLRYNLELSCCAFDNLTGIPSNMRLGWEDYPNSIYVSDDQSLGEWQTSLMQLLKRALVGASVGPDVVEWYTQMSGPPTPQLKGLVDTLVDTHSVDMLKILLTHNIHGYLRHSSLLASTGWSSRFNYKLGAKVLRIEPHSTISHIENSVVKFRTLFNNLRLTEKERLFFLGLPYLPSLFGIKGAVGSNVAEYIYRWVRSHRCKTLVKRVLKTVPSSVISYVNYEKPGLFRQGCYCGRRISRLQIGHELSLTIVINILHDLDVRQFLIENDLYRKWRPDFEAWVKPFYAPSHSEVPPDGPSPPKKKEGSCPVRVKEDERPAMDESEAISILKKGLASNPTLDIFEDVEGCLDLIEKPTKLSAIPPGTIQLPAWKVIGEYEAVAIALTSTGKYSILWRKEDAYALTRIPEKEVATAIQEPFLPKPKAGFFGISSIDELKKRDHPLYLLLIENGIYFLRPKAIIKSLTGWGLAMSVSLLSDNIEESVKYFKKNLNLKGLPTILVDD